MDRKPSRISEVIMFSNVCINLCTYSNTFFPFSDQLTALMTQLQQHNQQSAAQSPLQKIAKSQLLALRRRADEVLKKL